MVEVIKRSPQSILREWLTREIEGLPHVSVGDLLPIARKEFAKNEEFQKAIVDYTLPVLVEDVLRGVMSRNRKFTQTGRSYTTPEEIERLIKERLAHWYENSQSSVHAPILKMTAPELEYAIVQRRKRAATEIARAAFMEELREGLPDEETRVEDAYSHEELAAIYSKHFSKEDEDDNNGT